MTRCHVKMSEADISRGETVPLVSDRLGFEYPRYFNRMLRKREGITPSECPRRLHP